MSFIEKIHYTDQTAYGDIKDYTRPSVKGKVEFDRYRFREHFNYKENQMVKNLNYLSDIYSFFGKQKYLKNIKKTYMKHGGRFCHVFQKTVRRP